MSSVLVLLLYTQSGGVQESRGPRQNTRSVLYEMSEQAMPEFLPQQVSGVSHVSVGPMNRVAGH